jgi:hypothetical protein
VGSLLGEPQRNSRLCQFALRLERLRRLGNAVRQREVSGLFPQRPLVVVAVDCGLVWMPFMEVRCLVAVRLSVRAPSFCLEVVVVRHKPVRLRPQQAQNRD